MCSFHKTIDEHEFLLRQRGYDEESLRSPQQMGTLIIQLEEAFEKAMIFSMVSNKPENFWIETTGFFKDNLDVVAFTLSYQFNPKNEELYLRSLTASLERETKTFLLMDNTSLPSARIVYQLLAESKKMTVAKKLLNHGQQKRPGKKLKLK